MNASKHWPRRYPTDSEAVQCRIDLPTFRRFHVTRPLWERPVAKRYESRMHTGFSSQLHKGPIHQIFWCSVIFLWTSASRFRQASSYDFLISSVSIAHLFHSILNTFVTRKLTQLIDQLHTYPTDMELVDPFVFASSILPCSSFVVANQNKANRNTISFFLSELAPLPTDRPTSLCGHPLVVEGTQLLHSRHRQ
jgi:hypothetical protein